MKFLFKTAIIVIAIIVVANTIPAFANTGSNSNITFNPMEYINKILPQSYLLQDTWVDENNAGYKFYDTGTVKITYANFNIPIVNVPFNGEIMGTYTTEKINGVNYVTLHYSLFNQSIVKQYRYSIDNGMLTLTDPENGHTWVYFVKDSMPTTETTTATF